MYLLYSALLAIGLLLALPYWAWEMLRHGKYRTAFRERFGKVPAHLMEIQAQPTIWIHAVSVGEVLAISGLVAELQRGLPQFRVVISTTTDSGQKLARTRFGEENVFYFPLDFAFAVRPYLRALRPQLIILAETEFWPNFLRLAHQSGSRVAVVNARISDRSWPGYRRFRPVLRGILQNVDLFLAQTDDDAIRLRDIGAEPDRVQVSGNLKFDVAVPPVTPIVSSLREAFQRANAGPVIVCGSTVEGEEPLLLDAFANVLEAHTSAVMILAPRHPERFEEVLQLLEQLKIAFWRRSAWNGEAIAGGVFLIDTIGELAALYALGDIAFVGGSLVPRGGHNIIEPAQRGVPIIVGTHMENFREIVGLFQSRDAVRVVGTAELSAVLMDLLSNEAERRALGERAAETLKTQTGATQRTVDALKTLLEPAHKAKL
jgi:3-deoxy-D-manno-octulosonic-acid transferase